MGSGASSDGRLANPYIQPCQINQNAPGTLLVKGVVSVSASQLASVQPTGCRDSPIIKCAELGLNRKGQNMCPLFRGPRPICYLLDCDKCPDIGGVAAFASITNNATRQTCQYPLSAFQTAADINVFAAQGSSAEDIRTKVMPAFCAKTSTDCSNGKDTCSRFLDLGDDGAKCRTWALENRTLAQAPKAEYCLANKDAPECACFSRVYDPLYAVLKNGNPIVDSCWYKQCSGPDGMPNLIPADLMLGVPGGPTCPDNYCGILVQLYESTNVTLEELNFNLTCEFSQTPAPDTPAPAPQPTPPPAPEAKEPRALDKKIAAIILVAVLVLALLALLMTSEET